MTQKETYIATIRRCLESANRYTEALDIQIGTLASALMTLDIVDRDIASLNRDGRYCGDTLKMHPAFNVQRYMLDNVTRQMKALGLTAEQLGGEITHDNLADLTQHLIDVSGEADPVFPEEE